MQDAATYEQDRRAEIALRNRRRKLERRERKLTMAVFGLTGYSAVSNLAAGVGALLGAGVADAVLAAILGSLFAFAAYRVWVKDDPRWWPVGVPATINVLLSLLLILGGLHKYVPLAIGLGLLVLIPIRKRAIKDLEALSNNSFNPMPLRGTG